MAIEYFCCYHSYLQKVAKLSDQELGRLFRALLVYSSTGERAQLAGREDIAFDFIADDIDRAKKAYEKRCIANSDNGKMGGRPKKQTGLEKSEKSDCFSENRTLFQKTQKSQTKGKSKGKSKDSLPPISPQGEIPPAVDQKATGFSGELQAAFEQWLSYKRERRESYMPTGLRSLITQVRNAARDYGDSAVIGVIQQSMASGYKGIMYDRLKGGGRQDKPDPVDLPSKSYDMTELEQLANLRLPDEL